MKPKLLISEFLGTALLVATVVGSGHMATTLSQDKGIQLLINAAATGAVLYLLITVLGKISGAHFNPIVTLAQFFAREIKLPRAFQYILAQFVGGLVGVAIANAMYEHSLFYASTHVREGFGIFLGEFIATAGLVFVIFIAINQNLEKRIPSLVAGWITAGYFFTSSTSFANPAVTFARAWSDSFTGIAPQSVAAFIAAQLFGGAAGFLLVKTLSSKKGK
jgi:glycerol uptake facilitator-like aquaporin